MDRNRPAIVALAFLAALWALGAAPSVPIILGDQAWTEPSADLAFILTHAPAECLRTPADGTKRRQIAIGRALFKSPTLLGGPAARLGLSCNACHVNGHDNPAFFLPELTNQAGAADVTAEWASAVRGDGVMNPVPIPDLSNVSTKRSFGQANVPSLRAFVTSVIEEEFQGAKPPPQAFEALIAYLNTLSPKACPATLITPLTMAGAVRDIRDAIASADASDDRTASMVRLAAQEAIGRLVERLPETEFASERGALTDLARELEALRAAGYPPGAGWMARFDGLITAITPREADTYFNEETLRTALRGRAG